MNETTVRTHKNCVTCGRPYRINPYRTNGECSNCVRWRVISADIERNANEYIDDDWGAAV